MIVFHDFRLKPDICRDANGAWLEAPTLKIRDLTLAELETFETQLAALVGAVPVRFDTPGWSARDLGESV